MDDAEFAAILSNVRRWIREEVMPVEPSIEENDAVPDTIIEQARGMGLYGFALPSDFGGLGLSMSEEVSLVFELGYTTPALRSLFGTNNGIAGHVVMEGATAHQQAEFLPRLASGEWTASFALTEPEAGSDPAALRSVATREGTGWIINGEKRYITNAPVADVFMVFARTSPMHDQRHRGISVFLVPCDAPGLSIGPRDHKMGQRGAWTADVFLDNVHVDANALIGGDDAEGRGFEVAMKCLAHGRLHIAALCVGMMQRLVDESVAYARDRVQGGRPIGHHQLVQALIADSQTDLMAGRGLVLEAARAYDSGEDRQVGPSCAKLFCSEAVDRVADRAVQIHGGAGYMRDVAVERFYRDARLFRIYEGTSQIQQLIIGRHLVRAVT